jgi:pyrroline-5-carboxylate reductase
MTTYGVIGVGELGSALVTGLCDGVPNPPPVLLSPRGEEASSRLAARCPSTTVVDDNQAVVAGADVVLLCLRQADAGALDDLQWRTGQVAISAIAGLSLDRLAELVAPATPCRAVPMPEVATRSSETPLHPSVPEAVELFDGLGGALPLADADQYDAVFTVLGTVAPFFEYLGTLTDWATERGLPPELARQLVGRAFAGVGSTLRDADGTDFADLVRLYAPPGGGNALLTEALRDAGVFDDLRAGLTQVHDRLHGQPATDRA